MIRVLIVDDEAPARKRMKRLLKPHEESGQLEVVGAASDGFEALQMLESEQIDLLFLDIQMPELDGFDVLDRLPSGNRPTVVFTTAYDEYALKAFDANAIDYLLKPIDEERLQQSIQRVSDLQKVPEDKVGQQERLAELLEFLDAKTTTQPARSSTKDYLSQFSVPGHDRLIIVPVDDLISAEVHDGITRLYTLSADAASNAVTRHIVSYTLDALEHRLDPARFMRVHRSALIQVSKIQEMISWFSGRYKLVLAGGHEVIASRARSKELKDRLSL